MSAKDWEHEEHRFSYMTQAKLRTRLSRVTKPDKLLRFAWIAADHGFGTLAVEAMRKYVQRTGDSVPDRFDGRSFYSVNVLYQIENADTAASSDPVGDMLERLENDPALAKKFREQLKPKKKKEEPQVRKIRV